MFECILVCKLIITMSQKPKGRPVRKIVSDHFVPVEKVKNNSNRYFFKCNYCSASIDSGPWWQPPQTLNWPKAPADVTRTNVRGYLATKEGNQDLLSPPIVETEASSSLSESQGQTGVESRKRKTISNATSQVSVEFSLSNDAIYQSTLMNHSVNFVQAMHTSCTRWTPYCEQC